MRDDASANKANLKPNAVDNDFDNFAEGDVVAT
jgi:hypothetical protein